MIVIWPRAAKHEAFSQKKQTKKTTKKNKRHPAFIYNGSTISNNLEIG